VIPGEVRLSLDLRHGDDRVREYAVESLRETAGEIAAGRGVEHRWQVSEESGAVHTDPGLTAVLARAVEELGYRAERLPSGAGHDAAKLAEIAPTAMLFVRCEKGISHNPAESVEQEDVSAAIEVTSRFLKLVAESKG
jgi:allantoate deiminase